MAVHVPAKRATGLLNDSARARLRGVLGQRTIGYSSSGSEHEPSACLSGLVHAFFENSGDAEDPLLDADGPKISDEDEYIDRDRAADVIRELMDSAASDGDRFRLRLATDASSAKESLAPLGLPPVALRRAVMTQWCSSARSNCISNSTISRSFADRRI